MKCSISSLSAPNHTERHLLTTRRADLRAALAGVGPGGVVEIVAPMLMWYGAKPLVPEETRAVLTMYQHALETYPKWAVIEAVAKFNTGRMSGSTEFFPKPATLAKACADLVAPWNLEAHRITQILDAAIYHEPTAEERERVTKQFDHLLGTIAPPARPAHAQTPALDLSDEEAIRESFREAGRNSVLFAQPEPEDQQDMPE